MENKRIYQIDLFRFIAALSVVLYHYMFRGWAADNMSKVSFEKIGHFFKYGYLGVDLFFIISGFVIVLSIKHRSITKFVISRFSRLYPVYWVSLFLTFISIVLYGAPVFTANLKQLLINLSMFQNYINVPSIDGVYWTLFVEMKFYIFVIGAFLLLNKIKKISIDYLVYLWTLITLLYLPLKGIYLFNILSYFFILEFSSYFIAGIIFHQIYKKGLSIKYIGLLLTTMVISIYQSISRIGVIENKYNTNFSPFIIGGLILSFYIVMFLVTTNKLKKINSPKLIQIGMLTYPLYLLHQNIGFIVFNYFGTSINKYILVIVTTGIMVGASYIMSKYIEPPFSRFLKNKLQTLANFIKRN
jgi:peptidoglycan/LPS O-acetylase OafA/YrhL